MNEIETATSELNDCWVELETRGAEFGDKRLTTRYGKVLGQMSKMPQAPLNQSSESLAEMLGAYRFIDNNKISVENLLAPHKEQVAYRATGERTVLLVQDTCYLNLNDHFKCEDLGPLKLKHLQRSLWVHPTFCLLPTGLPLGVVDVQYMTGEPDRKKRMRLDSTVPIEFKKSRCWLDPVNNCEHLFGKNVRKVWLCDREADIYQLMALIDSKGEEYIIRSKHDREILEEPFFRLKTALNEAPVSGHYRFEVPGNGVRKRRTLNVAVKYTAASIVVPKHKQRVIDDESVTAYAVEAEETEPMEGEEVVSWRLVTNIPVRSFEDALRIITWYQKRWAIEELFKILKSGCRAEKAQFHNSTRLKKYITLSLIVAWRIYYLVYVNRVAPGAPATTILTSSELETLQLLVDDKRAGQNKRRRLLLKTANQAITAVAQLGGYLNRKGDPYPGIVVMWRGTMGLAYATMTFLANQRRANG